jgi:hypothetical protein
MPLEYWIVRSRLRQGFDQARGPQARRSFSEGGKPDDDTGGMNQEDGPDSIPGTDAPQRRYHPPPARSISLHFQSEVFTQDLHFRLK